MKETIDNKNEPSTFSPNQPGLGLAASIEEKKAAPKKAPKKTDEVEYTVSPDGKYKIPKPKSHATYIEDTATNIPYFDLPGRVVAWPHDLDPNQFAKEVAKGYEFVTEDTEDLPLGQQLVAHGGNRKDGSAYQHRAMYMTIERFNAINEARSKNLKDHELEQGIYATEQMTLATKYQHGQVKKD